MVKKKRRGTISCQGKVTFIIREESRKGKSQKQIAKDFGVNRTTLWRWKHGKIKLVLKDGKTRKTRTKITKRYNVTKRNSTSDIRRYMQYKRYNKEKKRIRKLGRRQRYYAWFNYVGRQTSPKASSFDEGELFTSKLRNAKTLLKNSLDNYLELEANKSIQSNGGFLLIRQYIYDQKTDKIIFSMHDRL